MKHWGNLQPRPANSVTKSEFLTETEMATSVALTVEEIARVLLGLILYPPTE